MKPSKIFIVGNSGSGKSRLAQRLGLPHFDLDTIAWDPGPVRRPIEDSLEALRSFIDSHPAWVIEGCYADLIHPLMSREHHLVFLDLPTEVCLAHCRMRPWEPHKFATPELQQEALTFLLEWVSHYPQRDDECSQKAHSQLYRDFPGTRRQCSSSQDVQALLGQWGAAHGK